MISNKEVRFALALSGIDLAITRIQHGIESQCKDDSAEPDHSVKSAVTWYQVDSDGVITRRGRVSLSHGRVMEWDRANSEFKVLPFCGSHENAVELFYRDQRFGAYNGNG
jgi:hypothetical protein